MQERRENKESRRLTAVANQSLVVGSTWLIEETTWIMERSPCTANRIVQEETLLCSTCVSTMSQFEQPALQKSPCVQQNKDSQGTFTAKGYMLLDSQAFHQVS